MSLVYESQPVQLKTPGKKFVSIDIARAIAALSVFLYHQHVGALLARYTKIGVFNYVDAFGALYAVPLFFLISGYCIHLSNLKYLKLNKALPLIDYYKRRFLRIYPPYLAAVIVSVAINRITHFGNMPSLQDSLVHLFSIQGFTVNYFNTINIVLWTITIEIAFYILYPIFYYFRLNYSLNATLLVTFIISAISVIYFSLKDRTTLPEFYFVGNIWFSWCTGAFLADKLYFDAKAFNKPLFKVLYALITVLFICIIYFKISFLSIAGYQLKILIWTGPLVYLLSKERWLSKQKSFMLSGLVFIGLSSYSLYLLHEPLIGLKNYIVHVYLPLRFQTAGLIAGIFIIPLIAWLNYILVEKPFIVKKNVQNSSAH